MARRGIWYGLFASCLVAGTLLLLMWPAPVGPYSATHGPATSLRAIRAAVLMVWSLTIAVRAFCRRTGMPAMAPMHMLALEKSPRFHHPRFAGGLILRC